VGRAFIGADDLTPALRLVEWHRHVAIRFVEKLATTEFAKKLRRVQEIIHKHGHGGKKAVPRRIIVQYAKLPPRELDEVLNTLREAGWMLQGTGPAGGAQYTERVDQC